ncbi:activating transcription factor 3 isoform X2 [Onthophagus taurus]|uniref:activating transcription factor 3 isoform X2 n=1 Tax=Onthophagus taurus TaxID=166361 RepID=UPI000C202598|nr:activating transcription factor 3 isoform X2 [Onthophagus taurus]
MYNLDTNLAASNATLNTLLCVETGATPRTPEILNSLMAMTNPLDGYNFGDDAPKQPKHHHHGTNTNNNNSFTSASSDSNSSSCSQLESPTNNGPNSVQQTCSQLIKAGLKLTIEQKRKHQNDNDDILDLDQQCKRIKRNDCSESEEDKINNSGLTAEDEERRRRRRERNKIAATKCRLKKRERTANLVNESEVLEKQNVDLKNQIQALQSERMSLTSMLQTHQLTCRKSIPKVTRDSIYKISTSNVNNNRQQHSNSPAINTNHSNHSSNNHSYNNNNNNNRQGGGIVVGDGYLDVFNRPNSGDVTFSRPIGGQFINKTTPTIIVESPTTTENNDFQTHLTNLDNNNQSNQQHIYQHNNYNSVQYSGQNYDNGCLA